MGTVASSLLRMRALIRDTGSVGFSDAGLLRLYNSARKQLFRDTEMRVRGTVLQIPPKKSYAVTQWWEQSFTGGSWWNPFFVSRTGYSCTQLWEIEMLGGETPQLSGGYCVTSPFELSFVEGENRIEYQLPRDCARIIWAGFYGEEIEQKSNKWLANYDPNFKSRQGDPIFFSLNAPLNSGFTPYPTPVTASSTAVTVQQIDAEDEDEEALVAEGFTFFCISVPLDISSTSSTDTETPEPFRKYIEFLASSMALKAETEFRDEKKAGFLFQRYKFGVQVIKECKDALKRDLCLEKRMLGSGVHRSGLGRPRFPEHY